MLQFNEHIKALRKSKNLTQEQIAEYMKLLKKYCLPE